ncbi:MAG: hypothetical protein NC300_11810 [Bacteroidales bacterium]|nr:hypothetical protein [Clostridium sp.]MCM1204818.1 hypothetical protein [Bacteroidales bacterium]
MDKDSLVVDGFVFSSQTEARIALKEKENIEVLRQRMISADGSAVYELYHKLIERDMFKTVIGYSFLSELRQRLLMEFQYDEEELVSVKLPRQMEYNNISAMNQKNMQLEVSRLEETKRKMSIVIVALLVMVIAMFVIAAVNPNAGYINTERKVINKYSAWEEELTQREKEVKEKEQQLNIKSGE